jgi:hypothetical protein
MHARSAAAVARAGTGSCLLVLLFGGVVNFARVLPVRERTAREYTDARRAQEDDRDCLVARHLLVCNPSRWWGRRGLCDDLHTRGSAAAQRQRG